MKVAQEKIKQGKFKKKENRIINTVATVPMNPNIMFAGHNEFQNDDDKQQPTQVFMPSALDNTNPFENMTADPSDSEDSVSENNGKLEPITMQSEVIVAKSGFQYEKLVKNAKKLWRAEFRKTNPIHRTFSHLGKKPRKAKMNSIFNDLSFEEKEEWIQFAEQKLREKSARKQIAQEAQKKTQMTRPQPSTSSTVVMNWASDDFLDYNFDQSGEDTAGASVVKEPLRNKKGNLIDLQMAARRFWKQDFRNSNPMHKDFESLNKNLRRAKLEDLWEELEQEEKDKWAEIAEERLRAKNAGVDIQNIGFSEGHVEPSGRNRRRPNYVGKKRDKESVIKDIPKPQEKFEFKIDNTDDPFVPILTRKPNSLDTSFPYIPQRKVESDGSIGKTYQHPYESEILEWTPDTTLTEAVVDSTPPPKLEMVENFELINSVEGVEEMLGHLKLVKEFAVDLEHHSVRTFMGLTCLIQISSRTKDFIIDGLAMYRKLECLNEVFTDPNIIKVFHGSQSDVQWLQRDFGIYVVGMFDTGVAGEQLFDKQLSLKYLLETYVDEVDEVDKFYQIADWRVRPLPADMIYYARMDTHYLLRLYDCMRNLLFKKGGAIEIQKAFLDSRTRCLIKYEKPKSVPNLKLFTIAATLNSRQKVAFIKLCLWRDVIARQLDESPELYILSDESLERLARTLPNNPTYLTEILESRCNEVISPVVIAEMDTIMEIIRNAREIPLSEHEKQNGENPELEDENVENNFDIRKHPVIPSIEELFADENNSIQKNILVGPFPSVKEYLHIQFNLLREDFIRSVKPGLKAVKNRFPLSNRCGIRVHNNIKFLGFGAGGIEKKNKWKIELPSQLLNTMRRQDSKRFLPGSLLLFSNNNFQETYCGLITHPRDKKAMEEEDNGIYSVHIRGTLPESPWKENEAIVTVECDAYFEPYKSVMTALKQNQWLKRHFMSQYLLNGKSDEHRIPPPRYVRGEALLNISSSTVPCSDLRNWPTPEEIGLDMAQYKAYQGALTQQFSLIQGPPGTGKTYIGLRILETLMEEGNRELWRGKGGGPILIMCYTNHALDQFGEGILNLFTPEEEKNSQNYRLSNPAILRVGTGCQSPLLLPYTRQDGNNIKIKGSNADILLLTTTGAAMRIQTLKKLKSKILIVEEAAEVFESHILSCLTPSLEHIILLGDHQQLRPITASHEMIEFGLNVSLFERLVLNDFSRHQLEVQHRMRPEIRDLITGSHIYPILKDSESVKHFPSVNGMEKPLFFMHHENPEATNSSDETSKSNPFEAYFLGSLCEYLLSRGHAEESITVLGMYSSQVRLLEIEIWHKRGISKLLRIETVDSFQGEENEIILLSLVRNNSRRDIGFMKEDNRICVAMSRAKHGLYMIGNLKLLASASATWRVIQGKLEAKNNVGCELALVCDNHFPKCRFKVKTGADVRYAKHKLCPKTGCSKSH